MNYRGLTSTFVGALCITVLAACGGGGGGDTPTAQPPVTPPVTPPPTTASFPVAAGFKARIDAGVSDTFDISDGCTGQATITLGSATSTTFEGVAAVASPQTSTATLNNCQPASSSSTGTTYYTSAYANLGLSVVNGEYAVAQATPVALPATVQIGNSGTIATLNTYTNAAKTTPTGTRVIKWRIEADGTSTTTAIFNLITENYNTSNLLLSTQQSRYRMAQNGTLAITTIDVQFSGTSVLHLLYTKR